MCDNDIRGSGLMVDWKAGQERYIDIEASFCYSEFNVLARTTGAGANVLLG